MPVARRAGLVGASHGRKRVTIHLLDEAPAGS
jgi:hypothetical protein